MISLLNKLTKLLQEISISKTFYFNFHYLPVKYAIYCPFWVYKHTVLAEMGGAISVHDLDLLKQTGNFRIGPLQVGFIDPKYSRTLWSMKGKLEITGGNITLGRGTRLCIGVDGVVKMGNNFRISGNSTIICSKEISFADDCLLSWDILIMDTDFHKIYGSVNNEMLNSPRSISLGCRVWIGCNTMILKGANIGNDVVISANSLITGKRKTEENNCVYGGVDSLRILKNNIYWTE